MNMNLLPCPKSNRTKLLEERLQKGKEAAVQLQTLLQKPLDNHGSTSAAQLSLQILNSFTDSLSVLEPNEICQILATDGPTTRSCSTNRPTSKTTTTVVVVDQRDKKKPGVKDRRGSYKRRNVPDSWMKLSSNKEDEYAWRKYGQKKILNSKFPRCYFRCTHKHDHGCKATKQVQRVEEDPLLYQTTYFGLHTCRTNMMRVPPCIILQEAISADPVEPGSSGLLSFDDKSKNIIIPSSKKRSGVPSANVISVKELDTMSDDASDNKSLLLLDSSSTTNNWLQELISSGHHAPPEAHHYHHYHHLDEEEEVTLADDVSCSVVYSCSSNTTPLPDFDHNQDMETEAAAAAAFSDHQFSDLDNINLYDDFERGNEYFFQDR